MLLRMLLLCSFLLVSTATASNYTMATTATTTNALPPPLNDASIRQAVQHWLQHVWDNRAVASQYYGDIRDWDTSHVTSFRNLFEGESQFNEDLSLWNTSSVTDMSHTFAGCSNFHADLAAWRTDQVRTFHSMFQGATIFRPATLPWNTRSATTMKAMFSGASRFNADLSNLDVSRVTDMSLMFQRATNFQGLGLAQWDTSSVASMELMFSRATNFNGFIGRWNVAKVQSTYHMFDSAIHFDQNVNAWNMENAVVLTGMFVNTPHLERMLCWPSLATNTVWQDAAGMFCDSPAKLDPCCLVEDDTNDGTTNEDAQRLFQQSCCAYSGSVSTYKQTTTTTTTCATECVPGGDKDVVEHQEPAIVAFDSSVYTYSTATLRPTADDDDEEQAPPQPQSASDYFFALGRPMPTSNDEEVGFHNHPIQIPHPTPDKQAVLESVELDDQSMTVALASSSANREVTIPQGLDMGDSGTTSSTGGAASNVGLLTGLFLGAFVVLLGVIGATTYRYKQAQRRAKLCTAGNLVDEEEDVAQNVQVPLGGEDEI